MKTKFRPGPWHISRYKEGRRLLITDNEGFDVAAVDYPDRDDTAALIAAAPDLYAALEAMLEVHGVTQEYADKHIEIPQSWVEASEIARAALAKARG